LLKAIPPILSGSKPIDYTVDWQGELKRIATKHHAIVCWVAIVLNPIWFIGDYFTIPAYWKTFFVIRMAVTALTLIGLLLRKKISTELLILIPFLGISLQNAYMWSVMEVPELQKHAFAYIALFIGGGMLVLWKPLWSVGMVTVSFIVNIIFLKMNSPLSSQEILLNGGMLVATVAIISVVLIHSRYALTKKEVIARLALAESNKELEQKKDIIEEKNKDITDSINYAKKIQEAILPAKTLKEKLFPDSFVMFQPRDIVSGDFYWFAEKKGYKLIAAVDCTGHGVPGAFMSMIGNAFLNQVVNEKGITEPAEILNQLRELIITALKQTGASGENQDGMDIALMSFSPDGRTVDFAGANNPLWVVQRGELKQPEFSESKEAATVSTAHLPLLTEIKGDKQPIGIYSGPAKPFTNQTVKLEKGMELYIATDGFADQMGGDTGKKLRPKNFKDLVISLHGIPMKEQELIIRKTMREWKGSFDQTDDILVIGIKI
jgi:sigma-B regulation protein RsbU (phosphoserine phosphatase)